MNTENMLEKYSKFMDGKDFDPAFKILRDIYKINSDVTVVGLLGFHYMNGLGVKIDLSKAIFYLKKAIQKGDAYAAHNLANLYLLGGVGVEKSPELSRKYFLLSKKLGIEITSDNFYERLKSREK